MLKPKMYYNSYNFIFSGYSRQQNKPTLNPKNPAKDPKNPAKDSVEFEKGILATFRVFIKESKYEDIFRDLASRNFVAQLRPAELGSIYKGRPAASLCFEPNFLLKTSFF